MVRGTHRVPLTHERRKAPFERPRNWLPAVPATRAAPPREDTAANAVSEARGSKDATRLSSVREIEDFPRAVRMHSILTTLPDDVRQAARIRRSLAPPRERVAVSNDSESRTARRRRRLGPCERAVRGVSPPRIRGAERRAWPASRRRACRGRSGFPDPHLNTTPRPEPGLIPTAAHTRTWTTTARSVE